MKSARFLVILSAFSMIVSFLAIPIELKTRIFFWLSVGVFVLSVYVLVRYAPAVEHIIRSDHDFDRDHDRGLERNQSGDLDTVMQQTYEQE